VGRQSRGCSAERHCHLAERGSVDRFDAHAGHHPKWALARRLECGRRCRTVLPYYPFTQASEKPVTPGLVTRFDIEIRPVFATLKPGHSLRLVLGTGDLPHLMPNTTEGPLLLGGIYSVQHNAASLSWIDIPVGTNPAS